FSSRRRHTRSKRDWSSDVCSSDLLSSSIPPPCLHSSLDTNFVLTGSLCIASLSASLAVSSGIPAISNITLPGFTAATQYSTAPRSEERRVGKELKTQSTRTLDR